MQDLSQLYGERIKPDGIATQIPMGTLPSAVAYDRIASWEGDPAKPRPVIMSVEALIPGFFDGQPTPFQDEASSALLSPDYSGVFSQNYGLRHASQGHLRVRYGSRGQGKERYIDISPGIFQLPSCSFVTVDAKLYNQSSGAGALNWTWAFKYSVGLSFGVYTGYVETPTASGIINPAAGTVNGSYLFPPGTVGLRMFTQGSSGDDWQLSIYETSPGWYVDYSTPAWAGMPAADLMTSREAAYWQKTGTATNIELQFSALLAW